MKGKLYLLLSITAHLAKVVIVVGLENAPMKGGKGVGSLNVS